MLFPSLAGRLFRRLLGVAGLDGLDEGPVPFEDSHGVLDDFLPQGRGLQHHGGGAETLNPGF